MAVDVANEPLKALQDKLAAISAVSALCSTRIGQADGMSFSGFPCVTFSVVGDKPGDNDAESWQVRDMAMQIDVFAVTPDQARTLAMAIDEGLNDACAVQAMDTTHWSAKILRRLTAWQKLDWKERDNTGGNHVVQLSSDWQYKVARKQSV